MKIHLICSDSIKGIVEELLKNRKIELDHASKYCVIEKDFELPQGKIGLSFEMQTLNTLMAFLDEMQTQEVEASQIITGRYEDRFEIIPYERISYFEGSGNDVFCITCDGVSYRIKEKLYELELKLRQHGFIRVSKPHLVNIAKVGQIFPWFNGKLMLRMEENDQEIDVTRHYVKDFKAFLGI